MSQRPSGYVRKTNDLYETPRWATEALRPHFPADAHSVWEPAAGNDKIANVIAAWGVYVFATDLVRTRQDFLQYEKPLVDVIVTNPPYKMATEFIEHALRLAQWTAMLLRTDFDHAQSRRHLFANCPVFAKKVVLTKRIVWFLGSTGSPSFNHSWWIWDRNHRGPPTIAYGP